MNDIKFAKVVLSLPSVLQPNTVYFVRNGLGFDLYVSDATGSIAYPINASGGGFVQPYAWPKRTATPKIINDFAGANLSNIILTPSRLYFFPFSVPRTVNLIGLRINTLMAANGVASIGIYNNATQNGNDVPGNLLVSTSVSTGAPAGFKTGTLVYTLNPGQTYWAALIASVGLTIQAVTIVGVSPILGRSGVANITYLYASGSVATLPAIAPTALTAGTTNLPAIYIIES